MSTTSLVLPTPGEHGKAPENGSVEERTRAFHFPYPSAYDIQLRLMSAVFRALEDRQVGVFESPTGTVRPSPVRTQLTPAGQNTQSALQRIHMAGEQPPPQRAGRGQGGRRTDARRCIKTRAHAERLTGRPGTGLGYCSRGGKAARGA